MKKNPSVKVVRNCGHYMHLNPDLRLSKVLGALLVLSLWGGGSSV